MTAPDERPLEVVKTADAAVRTFFERVWGWLVQGWTPARIARTLEAEGLKMPVLAPHRKIRWVPPTSGGITRIRLNPFYAGLLRIRRRRTERTAKGKWRKYVPLTELEFVGGKIEPYVSPEDFWRVQDQAASRSFPDYSALGSGPALCPPLYCGQCGRSLRVRYVYRREPTLLRKRHGYICYGPSRDWHRNETCVQVSGRLVDAVVEEVVFAHLPCPGPAAVRQAMAEENTRRQEGYQLLVGEVERARARVAEIDGWLLDSRNRQRNPTLVEHYESKLVEAIQTRREAEQRLARCPAPELLDTSDAVVADVAAVFQAFPALWRSGRLGPRERKAVVRHVIRRIDIPEKGDTLRLRITLQTGEVVERSFLTDAGRRHLIEDLHEKGLTTREIVAELRARGIDNHDGHPVTLTGVRRIIATRQSMPERGTVHDEIARLWAAEVSPAAIAEHLNVSAPTEHPWTAGTVVRTGQRFGVLPTGRAFLETLRAPIVELLACGRCDQEIAEEFIRRGLWAPEGSWNHHKVRHLRGLLGIPGNGKVRPDRKGKARARGVPEPRAAHRPRQTQNVN